MSIFDHFKGPPHAAQPVLRWRYIHCAIIGAYERFIKDFVYPPTQNAERP
jgi:hypothetical protein